MDTHQKLLSYAFIMRGQVLQHAIELEIAFDMYISRHFTKDETKQNELISLLLAPRMTFDSKFQVFNYLVDIYHPEFRKTAPNYSKDFKTIIEWRNMFAHYPIDFSTDAKKVFESEGKVSLVKLKNSKEFGLASSGTLTKDILTEYVKMVKKYARLIHKILGIDTASPSA